MAHLPTGQPGPDRDRDTDDRDRDTDDRGPADRGTDDRVTMRAVVRDRYGPPEVLEVRDVPRPGFAPHEVLIRVRAAGVDRGIWHLVTGKPYLLRPVYGLRRPRNPVPGLDVAGTVVEVGVDVTRFAPGDEVYGIARGSFAEFAPAREDKLAPLPSGSSFEAAACVPVSGLTALQTVRDVAQVAAGQRVLVIGASGGVGSFVVQLAKAHGAHVTGVCSTAKTDLLRDLGADEVVDRLQTDVGALDERFDAIVDIGGSTPLRRLRRLLEPHGTLALVGGEEGGRFTGVVPRLLAAIALSTVTRHRIKPVVSTENHADLAVLSQLLEAGELVPALDRTYPLEGAAEAMRALEDGEVRGKVAIAV